MISPFKAFWSTSRRFKVARGRRVSAYGDPCKDMKCCNSQFSEPELAFYPDRTEVVVMHNGHIELVDARCE
jgi:hypothetical protein